jgi:hypothetical protein
MLDLDEMKKQWAEHDRKLDESIRLNRQLLSTTNLNGARSAMQRMAAFLGLEAAVQLAVVVALGSFIYEHIAMMRFARVCDCDLDRHDTANCARSAD